MFSGSSAPQKNSQLQQRLDTLSSRVGQLLADCDRRIQPTTTELHSLQLSRRQNHRRGRGQQHIAREVQQVRDDVRRMSNRADIQREELQSMLQRQSRTAPTTTTTTLRHTRTPHQTVSTHIDLTLPSDCTNDIHHEMYNILQEASH